jgi:hypothetical protein
LLERVAPDLYEEYIMGKTKQRMTQWVDEKPAQKAKNSTAQKAKNSTPSVVIDLPKLSDLPDDHSAVIYARARKLPAKYFHDLYYAAQFKKWSVSIVPGAFSDQSLKYDDARIVIPFRDTDGKIFAFQGRALKKSKLKYLTVKIDQDKQKIYGLNYLKSISDPVLVVEGPLDSMFLENSVGTADSSLASLKEMFLHPVFIWDNEPRSPQIVKKIEKAVESGASVVIWQKSNAFNDINDAIQNFGYSIDRINELVKERTFSGLSAMLELNNWRKV